MFSCRVISIGAQASRTWALHLAAQKAVGPCGKLAWQDVATSQITVARVHESSALTAGNDFYISSALCRIFVRAGLSAGHGAPVCHRTSANRRIFEVRSNSEITWSVKLVKCHWMLCAKLGKKVNCRSYVTLLINIGDQACQSCAPSWGSAGSS